MDQEKVKFLNPEKIVQKLDIKKGETIADLGCGSGFLAIEMAKKVGEQGKIYAIDILEKQLESVESLARANFLFNIETIRANLEAKDHLKIISDQGKIDKVILSNVLSENENKAAMIVQAADILKTQGKLIIIDWKATDLKMGPARELLTDKEKVKEFCLNNNLNFVKDIEVGQFHWGIIFEK
ncbi:MAG: methyltransferase domain-containing protein [Candidatus Moranbacteria bacterium]|nr:methyltransferase domain-containing protein [Candidatus Moranbacteria bacterium]